MDKRFTLLAAAFAAVLGAGAAVAQVPKGWVLAGSQTTAYEAGLEARGGGKAAFIRARSGEAPGFGTLMQTADATAYRGKRLRLSAVMSTTSARSAQMWMRIDGAAGVLGFDNMNARRVTGTTDWKRYEIVLDVPEGSKAIAYGFFLSGAGKVAADEFRLETVGPNVPVTGSSLQPSNLSFEESRRDGVPAAG